MITLKDAVETVLVSLRDMQAEGHSMTVPLGLLSGVKSSLPEGGEAPVLLAINACEAIAVRAREAEHADLTDLAEQLEKCVRVLSPVVAQLL